MKRTIIAATCIALAAPANAGGKDIDRPKMERVIKAIPLKPHWRAIKIDEIEPNSVSLTIVFKVFPDPLEPESDTATVARVVLKELVAEGKNPSSDSTFLHVSAWLDGFKSETGLPAVHAFGTTDYHYASDSFEWRAWEK